MKITKEQFNSLPQLDRIEIRQDIDNINYNTGLLWIVSFVLIVSYDFLNSLIGTILIAYTIIRAFKFDRERKDKIYSEYFKVQVKRKKREVKK